MISILLKNVNLTVRMSNTQGEKFSTNVGVPQGDCLSPVLFTYYLAKALRGEDLKIQVPQDHEYCRDTIPSKENANPPELQSHTYCHIPDLKRPFMLDQQYADDIGWMSVSKCRTNTVKNEVPPKLKKRNLNVNELKTEEYSISRDSKDETWKKCKYVGSHPDTESDFKRRKQLASDSYQQHKSKLESKKISLDVRVRLFNAYVSSIFMYNTEMWSLNTSLGKRIDRYHRNMLRKMLKIKWPYTLSNKEVYERTKETKWSLRIKRRRMSWLGHLLRLPDETPAKQALHEALIPVQKPKGRPKTTWISSINQDLKEIDPTLRLSIDSTEVLDLAQDKGRWRRLVRSVEVQ